MLNSYEVYVKVTADVPSKADWDRQFTSAPLRFVLSGTTLQLKIGDIVLRQWDVTGLTEEE